ncbi:MAG: aspartate-semialdehyde dehydrogenase [Planctomycetes bacterium]|nr:aspartate-semialdehyde dehydrogenase [Planctomycetota bacterium]
MSAPRVAIVGATGAVGAEFLRVLDERAFPMRSLRLLASPRSAGTAIGFRGERHVVEALGDRSFDGVDVAFFSAGGGTSREWAPKAAVAAGAVVVDNSSAFRMHDDVPLVVPEVNRAAIAGHRGILANPNCSTILLVLALEPLRRAAGLRSVVVSTYQAASGAGQRAMDELREQTRRVLAGDGPPKAEVLPWPLAFNLFPQVDVFQADGFTKEEDKMLFEVRKILGMPELPVDATCVRVPVERCHSESVSVQLERALTVDEARALFAAAPGVVLKDDPARQGYPMPLDFAGVDEVAVGRVRVARVFSPGLTFWLCGDQLKKGAALNAVQIAEAL